MPPIVLTTLKFLFLALLYLFIARAVRVIYLDLVGPRVPRTKGQSAPKKRRGTPHSIVVRDVDQAAQTIMLETNEVTFGTSETCTVRLKDTYVSRMHARIYSKDGLWFVEDLGSTNGTSLNRVKVTAPSPVAVGDEIRFGKTIVEVRR